VRDFRVKLHGIKTAHFVGHASNGATVGAGHQFETMRQLGDLVAMAHPDFKHAMAFWCGEVLNAFEQGGVAMRAHLGRTKFPLVPAGNHAAQLVRHGLHAIANAQHRHAQFKHRLRRLVGAVFIDAGVAAGEDDALEFAITGIGAHPVVGHITGVHFAKHMRLTDAPRNQLGDLGAKVENENFLMHKD